MPINIEQEPGSSGETVIDNYQRKFLVGYAVRDDKPTGDKATRAQPLAAAAEAGNVLLVRGTWNRDFLDEIDGVFRGGADHDDQADAASGAHSILAPGNVSPGYAEQGVQRVPGAAPAFGRGGFRRGGGYAGAATRRAAVAKTAVGFNSLHGNDIPPLQDSGFSPQFSRPPPRDTTSFSFS